MMYKTPVVALTLQELLRARVGITTSNQLAQDLSMSKVQANRLWLSYDPIGLKILRRLKAAYGISLDELAEVREAVPAGPMRKARAKSEPVRYLSTETDIC